jgi:hypothetical protein
MVEAVITRQQHGKHISMAADTDATVEDAVFSMQSAPRLYKEDQKQASCKRAAAAGGWP